MVVHVGTSGWSYGHWENVLYPWGAPPRDRLGHYVRRFDTVELNSSFYRWPGPAQFARWRAGLPAGFVMSVKAPRGLTHAKKLYAPERWVDRFAAGWHELRDRRGVLLVQLPPQQRRDDARLDYFLGLLPPWLAVAVEFRHADWVHDDVFDLLARHRAAYCVMSGAGLPCVLRSTASLVYVRLHGPHRHHFCTAGPIPRRTCSGGRTASGNGWAWAKTSTRTSTTTVTATRSATPTPCGAWWVPDRVGR